MALKKRMEKMKKLSGPILKLYLLGKFLLVLGAGILIASYFPQYDWKFWGLVLVAVAILLKIPGFLRLCFK
jgi:hypothetical protein